MIICPICGYEIYNLGAQIICNNCGGIFENENSILRLHPDIQAENEDYDAECLDRLHEFENKHFWLQYRKKIILKAFYRFIKKEEKIIEIGAGTGNVSQMLFANGYKNMAVGEMHLNGLCYAKKYGLSELYQFDLLKAPFKKHFDVVCMFDVLEHIEDDNLALLNVSKMLTFNGKIILTVPSHMWLWSNIDFNSGHKRRYNYWGLKILLEKNDFEIIHYSSFFILTLPLLFFRAIFNKKNIKIDNANLFQNAGMTINPITNAILKFICNLEYLFFSKIPLKFGGSLLVIARKINRD